MMRLLTTFLSVAVFCSHFTFSEYSINDASLFRINFGKRNAELDILFSKEQQQRQWDDQEEQTEKDPQDGLDGRIIMTTNNNEKYSCALPMVKPKMSSDGDAYTGPNPLQILNKLFVTQACAYRLDHYWTYEVCHGRYIRQFHEEMDGKKVKHTTEYYLGKYDVQTFERDVEHLDKLKAEGKLKKPGTKRVEVLNLPYYELVMGDGTICDINGRPRMTRVNYVCYPAGKHEIFSLKESSTCEYDITVLSPLLCQHPDYHVEETSEHVIDCKPLDEKSPFKPRNLIQMEAENLKYRSDNKMFEGNFMQGNEPGTVKIEIKQVKPEDFTDEDLEDDIDQYKDEHWPKKQPREPVKPLMDPDIVKKFLMGDYCLYGGTGWWKYEFCYGKKVDQYHEEKNGKKIIINLGRFNEQKHLDWIMKNPAKMPKKIEARKHVSHLYSDGDICDLTKQPRSVEVKLKCKKSESSSAVSLYLLEPKPCEYILGVESPLVCDILHLADDQHGLMSFDKEYIDGLGQKFSKPASYQESNQNIMEPKQEPQKRKASEYKQEDTKVYDLDGFAQNHDDDDELDDELDDIEEELNRLEEEDFSKDENEE